MLSPERQEAIDGATTQMEKRKHFGNRRLAQRGSERFPVRRFLTALTIATALCAQPSQSSGSPPSQAIATLDQQIAPLLAENRIASVSFATIEHGRISQVKAFGEQSRGVRATPATLYNIASLTKPLTAEIILRLASQKKLSLDEPMDSSWIDPDLVNDKRHSLLTPRLALTHRTGLPNWRSPPGLAFVRDPGTAWGYSGEGFQYVARFAAARMHVPLDRLADSELFRPLGMHDTSYIGKPWFSGRVAVPTDAAGKALLAVIPEKANAADLVYSTPHDYAVFMLGVLTDKGLSKAIARQRSTSQVSMMDITCTGAKAASCPPHVGFGLGWQLLDWPGEKILMHTGKDEGVFTFAYLNRTTGEGVVIFTNSDNGYKIILPLLERLRTSPAYLGFLRGQID